MNFYIKKEGGVPPLTGRIERITRKFKVDTQRVRAQLIGEFEDLVQYCLKRAKMYKEAKNGSKSRGRLGKAELKDRREWARAAAYIGQVINSISREYDSSKILTELEELKRMMAKIEQSQNKKGDAAVKGGD